jgi:glycosyltransferase involved in cell wall biosynthesis
VRSVSIVLPAFNEAPTIARAISGALAAADGLGLDAEVIVVDDGSRDATATAAASIDDPRARLLRHPRNIGYGAALKTGILASRKEHIFFTDADLQFDLDELGRLSAFADDFDIIVGYRVARQDSWLRRVDAWAWNRLVDACFDIGVRDIDCAFKIFHRRVFSRIAVTSIGAFVNSEILVRARAQGFRTKEVPVSHFPRQAGTATGAHPRVIARALSELLRLHRELRAGRGGVPLVSELGAAS